MKLMLIGTNRASGGLPRAMRGLAARAGVLVVAMMPATVTAEPLVVVTLPAKVEAKADGKGDAKASGVMTGLLAMTAEQRSSLKLDAASIKDVDAKGSGLRVMQVGGQALELAASESAARAMLRWIGPDEQPVTLIELPATATASPAGKSELKPDAKPESKPESKPDLKAAVPALTFQDQPMAIYTLDGAKVARGEEILKSAATNVRSALKKANGGQDPLAGSAWKMQRKVLLNRPDAAWRVLLLEGTTISASADAQAIASKLLQAWWCEVLGAAAATSPKIAEDAALVLLAATVMAGDEPWIGASEPAGQFIPLWSQQDGSTRQLFNLTQPARGLNLQQRWTPARQREMLIRLEAMLAASKVHYLWIIDEGGSIDEKSRASLGLLGVMTPIASMQSRLQLLANDTAIAPLRAASAQFATSELAPVGPANTARLDPIINAPMVIAGDAQSGLVAVVRPMEVKPPGLLVDRWTPEWSHQRFTSQSLAAPSVPGATMLIQMQQPTGVAGQEPSVMIYLEWPASITQVRVHIGSLSQQQVITIDSLAAQAEPKASLSRGLRDQAARVRAVPKENAFAATVELAPDLIEPEGVIRLAVELSAASGERWSWPRAMLPWQQTPGRMPLATGTWDVFPQQP
jgi:hypothetical protein